MYNNTSEKTPFNSKKTSHVFKSTIYSNMLLGPLHTRVHCVRSVNTTQTLLIFDAEYFTLNKG